MEKNIRDLIALRRKRAGNETHVVVGATPTTEEVVVEQPVLATVAEAQVQEQELIQEVPLAAEAEEMPIALMPNEQQQQQEEDLKPQKAKGNKKQNQE